MHDQPPSSIIIGKPKLTPFLRTKLRMVGLYNPYSFIDAILTSRKTGYDIQNYYDTWDNQIDASKITDANRVEIDVIQDQLLTILTNFINSCPLTSYLLHMEIKEIIELPDGLRVDFFVDQEQIDNTRYNQPPEGYVHGTLVGY